MKYYVIEYDDGSYMLGEFSGWSVAYRWASSHSGGRDFTLEEYESEEDYLSSL